MRKTETLLEPLLIEVSESPLGIDAESPAAATFHPSRVDTDIIDAASILIKDALNYELPLQTEVASNPGKQKTHRFLRTTMAKCVGPKFHSKFFNQKKIIARFNFFFCDAYSQK